MVGLVMNLSIYDDLYDCEADGCRIQVYHVPLESKCLPSETTIQQVISRSTIFWKENPESSIAVHCAYGAAQSLECRSDCIGTWTGVNLEYTWKRVASPSCGMTSLQGQNVIH